MRKVSVLMRKVCVFRRKVSVFRRKVSSVRTACLQGLTYKEKSEKQKLSLFKLLHYGAIQVHIFF